jgi:hypothetical protein
MSPAVLKRVFLDADIEEIIKAYFDIEELEEELYLKYTTLAQTIYLEKEPPDFTISQLGCPPLQ